MDNLSLIGLAVIAVACAYFYGRHDGRSALEAEQAKANLGSITLTIGNVQKVDDRYEQIFATIQAIPSVSKTCLVPPAIARTFELLPDAPNSY